MSRIILPGQETSITGRSPILLTKRGTRIETIEKLPRAPESQRAAAAAHHRPGRILRSLQSTYNCIGMVFATRRWWVEPENFSQFMRDDEFVQVSEAEVMAGDVVVYSADSEVVHVGIIQEKIPSVEDCSFAIRVLSQWGQDGEYIHDYKDFPDGLARLGTLTLSFWSERVSYV